MIPSYCLFLYQSFDVIFVPLFLTIYSFDIMQAVHSGADLEAAISNCMGYKTEVLSVICILVTLLSSALKT